MNCNIGISQDNAVKVADVLKIILANEYVLYTKTKNAHWNVVGTDFYAMHTFFEKQYDEIDEIIDEVAERIRSLGVVAPGSLQEFLKLTTLKETTGIIEKSDFFVKDLLNDQESLIRYIRSEIQKVSEDDDDLGTGDYITGLLEKHEKMAWMLRSSLS